MHSFAVCFGSAVGNLHFYSASCLKLALLSPPLSVGCRLYLASLFLACACASPLPCPFLLSPYFCLASPSSALHAVYRRPLLSGQWPPIGSGRSECTEIFEICLLLVCTFCAWSSRIKKILLCKCDLSFQSVLHVVASWARRCQINLFFGLSVGGRSSTALSESGAAPLLHDLHFSLVSLMRGRGPPPPSFINCFLRSL